MPNWMRILGLTSLEEPRGVRADFCESCLTIGPHWAFDAPPDLSSKGGRDRTTGKQESFQLCQICAARTSLPERIILAPRQAAAEMQIDELLERTHPELGDAEGITRIQTQMETIGNSRSRKIQAMSAFAFSQQDLANDLLRLASIRAGGLLLVILPVGVKLFRNSPAIAVGSMLGMGLALTVYRLWIVPRLVRAELKPAWVRLLSAAGVRFDELSDYLRNQRGRFPLVAWLMKSPGIRILEDPRQLQQEPGTLRAGIDFLPPPRSRF